MQAAMSGVVLVTSLGRKGSDSGVGEVAGKLIGALGHQGHAKARELQQKRYAWHLRDLRRKSAGQAPHFIEFDRHSHASILRKLVRRALGSVGKARGQVDVQLHGAKILSGARGEVHLKDRYLCSVGLAPNPKHRRTRPQIGQPAHLLAVLQAKCI